MSEKESKGAVPSRAALKEGKPPAMPSSATAQPSRRRVPPMPPGAFVHEEGTVQPMPPGGARRDGLFLLEEHARRACFLLESAERHEEQGESSNSGPKRHRSE